MTGFYCSFCGLSVTYTSPPADWPTNLREATIALRRKAAREAMRTHACTAEVVIADAEAIIGGTS